jgi:hypothetical protein
MHKGKLTNINPPRITTEPLQFLYSQPQSYINHVINKVINRLIN